jgi:hypothetical protein
MKDPKKVKAGLTLAAQVSRDYYRFMAAAVAGPQNTIAWSGWPRRSTAGRPGGARAGRPPRWTAGTLKCGSTIWR